MKVLPSPRSSLRLFRLTCELSNPSLPQLVEALRFLLALITLSDEVEQATLHLRPRERERGIATQLRSQILSQIASLSSRQELEEQRQTIPSPFQDAPQDRERPVLRIGLIGDPYSISEPFFNRNLEQELGYLGVEVARWGGRCGKWEMG